MGNVVRPTKKQRELLTLIQEFITAHGYGPSYREIMVGCNYTSVATVALHVNNLIARGHIRKKDRSARSLEIISQNIDELPAKLQTNEVKPTEEKWLVEKIEYAFQSAESASPLTPAQLDNLYVLVGALKVLGVEGAAHTFTLRLAELKKHVS